MEESQSGANPDEIDIDEDEEEEEEEGEGEGEVEAVQVGSLEKMDVPDKVFGGLKKSDWTLPGVSEHSDVQSDHE